MKVTSKNKLYCTANSTVQLFFLIENKKKNMRNLFIVDTTVSLNRFDALLMFSLLTLNKKMSAGQG